MYGHGDAAERLLTPPPRYPIPRLGRGRDPVQAADLVAPPSIVVGGSKHTIVHEPTLTEGAGLGESRKTAAETERDRLLHPEPGAQMSPVIVRYTDTAAWVLMPDCPSRERALEGGQSVDSELGSVVRVDSGFFRDGVAHRRCRVVVGSQVLALDIEVGQQAVEPAW